MTYEHISYTTKERALVDTAFRAIDYACDCWDHTAPDYLRRALKSGKDSGRRSITEAKAMVINAFAKGATKPAHPADLYGMIEGYQLAHILGAAYARRMSDDARSRLPEILEKAAAGYEAHDGAFHRFLHRHDRTAA